MISKKSMRRNFAVIASCCCCFAAIVAGHDVEPAADANFEPVDCSRVDDGDYNVGQHIASIFVMLFVSGLGAALPLLGRRSRSLRLNSYALKVLRCFGAGIILTTGLVHILFPAIQNLTNPCLPQFFTQDYPALAAVLAISAILLMQMLDIYSRHFRIPSGSNHTGAILATSHKQDAMKQESGFQNSEMISDDGDSNGCSHPSFFTVTEKKRSLYFLEFAVAVHSIVIGFSLGLARGKEFPPLLVALIFHQFFEGIALGAMATSIELSVRSIISLIIIYGLTTPIGIVLGVVLNVAVNPSPNSPESLLATGVLDSLAAGILIYTAIADSFLPNFRSIEFYRMPMKWKLGCVAAVWLGAGLMSVIAVWA